MRQSKTALRPIGDGDDAFLFALYASTRAAELAAVPWSDAEREAFLRQQFSAQQRGYAETYAGAFFGIILVDDVPAGRLYVARWPAEIRLVDISLVPEHRGRGVGTELIRRLQAEAAACGRPLTIHVEVFNPALALYRRLGFVATGTHGPYHFMEWRPPVT